MLLFQIGWQEQIKLGHWLGERYRTLFGKAYSKRNIRILSSSVSRAIFSAKSAIQGVYPYLVNDRESLIEIEILAKKDDNVVANTKPCEVQNTLRKEVIQSKPFESNLDYELYEYLRNVTKMPVYNFSIAFFMYDSLEAEDKESLTLPEWSRSVYPDKMKEQALYHVLLKTFTYKLTRMQVGPLWFKITSFLRDFISNPKNSSKVFLISGHQHNLVNILVSLGDYDYSLPSFSSSVIFELRQRNGKDFYIKIYLKNETSLKDINLKNCSRDCHVFEAFKILEPITTDPKQWDSACNPVDDTVASICIASIAVVGVLLIFGIIYCKSRMSRKKFKLIKTIY